MSSANRAASWEDVLTTVRDGVNSRKGDWADLCDKARVSYHWLRRFAEGAYKSPDAHRVERLAGALGFEVSFSIGRDAPSQPRGGAASKLAPPPPGGRPSGRRAAS